MECARVVQLGVGPLDVPRSTPKRSPSSLPSATTTILRHTCLRSYCSPSPQHTLLSALPERTHARPPIHLPNTLRRQARNAPPIEKMVDTALAADLLEWARRESSEWALVLSEDDDVVPPPFTAEAWIRPHGGRAFIVRASRPHGFLKLDGLLMEMNG